MDATSLPDDDTLFIRAAVREDLLTEEQIAEGRDLQGKMRELGLEPKPIGDILLERGYLSEAAATKLKETMAKVREAFRIPGFKLLQRLGRGSMGTVYKARQLNLDRLVAIKILARFLSENQAFVRRFMKEARVIGKLNHPNIVQGFDAGETNGTYFFAMEYCSGPTLLKLLQRGGAMDQERAMKIIHQVASALSHAYDQGLIHRDVKPDNIMIVQGGVAKLCDLGLAKDVSRGSGSTEKGATLGTPNYISPEQARGDADIDIRSDIYSLGATFYHAVTGVLPFDGPNPTVIMVKHLNEPPIPPRARNPDVKPDVERVILRMMNKHPDDRYQTPEDLVQELENIMAHQRGEPLPHHLPPPLPRKGRGIPPLPRRRRS